MIIIVDSDKIRISLNSDRTWEKLNKYTKNVQQYSRSDIVNEEFFLNLLSCYFGDVQILCNIPSLDQEFKIQIYSIVMENRPKVLNIVRFGSVEFMMRKVWLRRNELREKLTMSVTFMDELYKKFWNGSIENSLDEYRYYDKIRKDREGSRD